MEFTHDQDARRGFTLLEAMIVVAIIGLLTMILFPPWITFMKRADCQVLQARVKNAADFYVAENGIVDATFPATDLVSGGHLLERDTTCPVAKGSQSECFLIDVRGTTGVRVSCRASDAHNTAPRPPRDPDGNTLPTSP